MTVFLNICQIRYLRHVETHITNLLRKAALKFCPFNDTPI